MSDRFSVEVNGKEVPNPVLRVLWLALALAIVVIVLAAIPVILIVPFAIIVGAAVLTALLVIPHFILRMAGRHGFFKWTRDETTNETSFDINISGEAFRRV